MSLARTPSEIRRNSFCHGEFFLLAGESIDQVVARESVDSGYGVYIISGCIGESREILYIGRAGTVKTDGEFKEQGLRKRLTMKQDGEYRRDFFPRVIAERGLDRLHFEWFVTVRDRSGLLPCLAEARLLDAYWTELGGLPPLNKCA